MVTHPRQPWLSRDFKLALDGLDFTNCRLSCLFGGVRRFLRLAGDPASLECHPCRDKSRKGRWRQPLSPSRPTHLSRTRGCAVSSRCHHNSARQPQLASTDLTMTGRIPSLNWVNTSQTRQTSRAISDSPAVDAGGRRSSLNASTSWPRSTDPPRDGGSRCGRPVPRDGGTAEGPRLYSWEIVPSGVVYIAVVEIPPAVEAKILGRGVTAAEVREAVVLTSVLRARWHRHPDRGWRLLVVGLTFAGRSIKVVLYPVDANDGIWRLGTAFDVPTSGA